MSNFYLLEVNWESTGYFNDFVLPSEIVSKDPNTIWKTTLNYAKEGKFEYVSQLFRILKQAVPSPLAMACSDLLGDAGTNACFELILEEIKTTKDFNLIMELCNALQLRGKLSDVLTLLSAYEKTYKENKDADIFPVWIADLIEPDGSLLSEPSEFVNIQNYQQAVINRCKKLEDYLGTEQAVIYKGELFSVTKLAQYILARIHLPYLRVDDLRHKFEAVTGVDCSSFFKNGKFQPLSAAALLEQFLESYEVTKYKNGVRYFFGHRIPD
jgi:hypothetical protein